MLKEILACNIWPYLGRSIYLFIFSVGLSRKKHYCTRLFFSVLFLVSVSAAFAYIETLNGHTIHVPGFLLWILFCIFALTIVYQTKPVLYFYWSLVSAGAFGLFQSVINLVNAYWSPNEIAILLVSLTLFVVIGAGVYFLMIWNPYERKSRHRKQNLMFFLIVFVLMFLFAIIETLHNDDLSGIKVLHLHALLSFLALFLLHVFQVECNLRDDYAILHELLEKDKIRYEISKEYTDLLNMKLHDIKHQIRKFRKQQTISPEYLGTLEDTIRHYDSDLHTGNEALDIILTEKNRLCTENHIEMTIIADGESLSFIAASDLYSIFGNILDNAIEATQKLTEDDKKQISLVISKESGIVRIKMQNYFAEAPKPNNDGFFTTKKDTEAHGFGIKSVKYIVAKYGGAISTEIRENIFTINIIFPPND